QPRPNSPNERHGLSSSMTPDGRNSAIRFGVATHRGMPRLPCPRGQGGNMRAATGIVTVFLCAFGIGLKAAAPPPPAGYRTDRILVRPKAHAPLSAMAALHSQRGHSLLRSFSHIANLQIIRLHPHANVQAELQAYRRSGLVDYAEPDFIVH